VIDTGPGEELPFDEWADWDGEPEPVEAAPTWRKPALIIVATITAVAMAAVPLYNVFQARTVAENGLEVCGFDYCVVQEAAVDAGVDLVMSRLWNTLVDEESARLFATDLTDYLGVDPVGLQVVDDLEGRLGGVYDPESRSILIARPARAWTVLHEVAHAAETGHGPDFRELVIELARWVESGDG
jgi:hypothetical protein